MTHSPLHQVLYALFSLSRANRRISATTLAAEVGMTPTRTAELLVELERRGLVDASRARLTMQGLVVAANLGPAGSGSRRLERPAFRAPEPPSAPPLAAAPAASPAPRSAGRELDWGSAGATAHPRA